MSNIFKNETKERLWLASNVTQWEEGKTWLVYSHCVDDNHYFANATGVPEACYMTHTEWVLLRDKLGLVVQLPTKEEAEQFEPTPVNDPVNKPKHYQMFADGTQAIDIIEASLTPEEFAGYCKGNALKYRLRAGNKDKLQQDIDKADWYANKFSEKQ